MLKVKVSQLGWVVAAGVIGVMAAGGFQGPTLKFGTADIDKVLQSSDYWKTSETSFNAFTAKVKDLLSFLDSHRYLTSDQLSTISKLSMKDGATPQETAELNRVKDQATADNSRYNELVVKANLTPEERTALNQFSQQGRTNEQAYQQIVGEENQQVDQKRQVILQSGMEKARAAVQSVGKAQGFTLVLSTAAAPYGANDITDDAIKAMNAAKG